MGTALLAAAEADARQRGRRGMAAWGLVVPAFMRASWQSTKSRSRPAAGASSMGTVWIIPPTRPAASRASFTRSAQ